MQQSIIEKYFPEINQKQKENFSSLVDLYQDWNSKINVISRKDMDEFMIRHVIHSLSMVKKFNFLPGSKVLDVGTGGGFPGIPLAIFFPDVEFLLTDSIGKKIKVVKEVALSLNLKNVKAIQTRSEEVKDKFDFIVTRAVAEFDTLYKWTKNKYKNENNHTIVNGLICLKGGDLSEELKKFKNLVTIYSLSDFFNEEFFETKKIVYLPCSNR